jgi:hypothetical protein
MIACKVCAKSKVKRDNSGMINRICVEQDRHVQGFESCGQFGDRQCTLCVWEKEECSEYDRPGRCDLCCGLDEKPYFELRTVENDEKN